MTACNDSGGSSNSNSNISGIVVDDPLAFASITVFDINNGQIIATGQSDAKGEYSIDTPNIDQYRIRSEGGFLNGTAFNGTMENICDPSQECDITPLTTVAVRLVDRHGFRLEKARKEAARILGFESNATDPFVLAVRGEKNENGTIEGLDRVNLEYIRGRINDANSTLADWLNATVEQVAAPYDARVTGTAELVSPLEEADVLIIDEDGYAYTTTTDNHGEWESPEDMKLTGAFRVEISKGTSASNAFPGTLSAYVPFRAFGYDDEQNQALVAHIKVNILSTLIDRYMEYTSRDFEDASARVKRFLSIPEDVAWDDDQAVSEYFTPSAFRALCAQSVGFDSFVDNLVFELDSGDTVSMKSPANLEPYVMATSWGGKIFQVGASGLISAGAGFGLKAAEAYLVPALGFETPDQQLQQALAGIQDSLNDMNNKLNSLGSNVDNLTSKLSQTLSATLMASAKTEFSAAKTFSKRIETNFNTMMNLKSGSDNKNTFEKYNNFTRFDVLDALSQIYTHLYEDDGAMEYLTQALVEKIKNADIENRGNVLWDSYVSLEKYFSRMMGIQYKGVILYLNKFNMDNNIDYIESDRIEDTKGWKDLTDIDGDNPYSNILEQTDLFMTYVERLVVASANTKTVLGEGYYDMFPSTMDNVFTSADLLVQTFSPKHRAAFVYRAIGDPKIIHQYWQNDWVPKYFGTTQSLININGKTVRDYTAPLPDNYPNYYLSWSVDSAKSYHFNRQTKIRIVKMYFKKIEQEIAAKPDSAFPFSKTYSFANDEKDVVTFSRINPSTGIAYSENDEKNGIVAKRYGHCTAVARIVPGFSSRSKNEITTREDKIWCSDHSYNLAKMTTQANYWTLPFKGPWGYYEPWAYIYDGKKGEIATHINIHSNIVNDETNDIKLTINGTVEENVTNNKGGDRWMALREELHWDISVDQGTIFGRKFEYDRNSWGAAIDGSHNNLVTGSKDATWTSKKMRKLYLNTRNYMKYSAGTLYEEPGLQVDFSTRIKSLELK